LKPYSFKLTLKKAEQKCGVNRNSENTACDECVNGDANVPVCVGMDDDNWEENFFLSTQRFL